MLEIDDKEIDKIIKLSRIACNEEERLSLQFHIRKILKYTAELDEVEVDGIEPCTYVLETLKNVMREDAVGETLPRDLFLANAPSHIAGLIRVPPVIASKQS